MPAISDKSFTCILFSDGPGIVDYSRDAIFARRESLLMNDKLIRAVIRPFSKSDRGKRQPVGYR